VSADLRSNERLHSLDALRAIALLLGVFYHAALSFVPDQYDSWPFWDSRESLTLHVFAYCSHMMRMTLFFLLAGLFARLALQRHGLLGFAKDRGRRIAILLFLAWPVLLTATTLIVWLAPLVTHQPPRGEALEPTSLLPTLLISGVLRGLALVVYGTIDVVPRLPVAPLPAFPLLHLWFLYLLLIFYAVAISAREIVKRLDTSARWFAPFDQVLHLALQSSAASVLLGAIPAALMFAGDYRLLEGIPSPARSLLPNALAAVAFVTAFAVGWWTHRHPNVVLTWKSRRRINLSVAIAATCISYTLCKDGDPEGLARLVASFAYGVGTWAWSFAALGYAVRHLSARSRVLRYLADSSYWIYVVHLPVILALQVITTRLSLNPLFEFALIIAAALPTLLLSYQLLARRTFISTLLGGKPPVSDTVRTGRSRH
jgi:peptidoglycan/LPS O-acetylase OafA/YrhL